MAEVAREGGHGMAGVAQLQHARDDKAEVALAIGAGGEDWELINNKIGERQSTNFLSRDEIQR